MQFEQKLNYLIAFKTTQIYQTLQLQTKYVNTHVMEMLYLQCIYQT